MGPNDQEIQELAQQFQQVADTGGFNPFALFAGSSFFHSIFIADFSPSIRQAMALFQAGEPGPLDGLAEEFIQQGHNAAVAREQVQNLLHAAVGMCVVTLYNDQSFATIPQLFFGHLSPDYKDQVVQLCGDNFPDPEGLRTALDQLAMQLHPGQHSPQHFARADGTTKAIDYWTDFAQQLRDLHENGMGLGADERQKDLAHWVASSVNTLAESGHELDGDQLLDVIHCYAVARHIPAALKQLDQLLDGYEPEDEELLLSMEFLSKIAIYEGQADLVSAFITSRSEDMTPLLGGVYEWEILRFKLLVANQASCDDQLAQAEELKKADRKSFRHDLNREPLWQVTTQNPGPFYSVQEAANFLNRSVNFVAKRLESGNLPFVIQDDERQIPENGLTTWKAIMETHELID